MDLIRMMQSFFTAGVRPQRFQKYLCEMHSIEYNRRYLKREYEIARQRRQLNFGNNYNTSTNFGKFADPNGYGAHVPTPKYLKTALLKYIELITPALDDEVKKRGAKFIAVDASFKLPKLFYK